MLLPPTHIHTPGFFFLQKFLRVDPEIFENALRFSLEARISPLWNRVSPTIFLFLHTYKRTKQ